MGNPEQDDTEGMDPVAKKTSEFMEGFAADVFGKPRREHDPNRKVGRDALYGNSVRRERGNTDGILFTQY